MDQTNWLDYDVEEMVAADKEFLWHHMKDHSVFADKEQMVIRVTFQWYRPGKPHQRLPNDVVADLAETLQTTSENLRQIRRRALIKIREFLLEQPRTPGLTGTPRTERGE